MPAQNLLHGKLRAACIFCMQLYCTDLLPFDHALALLAIAVWLFAGVDWRRLDSFILEAPLIIIMWQYVVLHPKWFLGVWTSFCCWSYRVFGRSLLRTMKSNLKRVEPYCFTCLSRISWKKYPTCGQAILIGKFQRCHKDRRTAQLIVKRRQPPHGVLCRCSESSWRGKK